LGQSVQITILAAALIIVVFVITTSKNGRKFEAAHKTGLYKAGIAVRVIEFAFLLFFCASAYLILKGVLGQTAGYILMTVFFICWLPFQFWMYSYIHTSEEMITYFSPSGKQVDIKWKDVKLISSDSLGLVIRSKENKIRVYSFFLNIQGIREAIKKNCPGQIE
jgi:hypothetical protein